MLTIFSTCKPFKGHFGIIQRNAIQSWTLLRPKPEIILFGNDEGTAKIASEFGARHVPQVLENEDGAPMLNDLFEKAQYLASFDLLCYVNADIILMNDFMQAIHRVKDWRKQFLLTGIRWNVDMSRLWDFEQLDWEKSLRERVYKTGHLLTAEGLIGFDYFVFRRSLFVDIPPVALGRGHFDTWLVWKARAQRFPVVNATEVIMAVHQNHDYSHIERLEVTVVLEVLTGDEAWKTLEVLDSGNMVRRSSDMTHRLTPNSLRLDFAGYFHLHLKLTKIWFSLLRLSRPLRHALGLHSSSLQKLMSLLNRWRQKSI
jgi:hypothetical protein